MTSKQISVSLDLLDLLVVETECRFDEMGCVEHNYYIEKSDRCPQAILKDIILNAQFDGDPIAGLQKIRDELEEAE